MYVFHPRTSIYPHWTLSNLVQPRSSKGHRVTLWDHPFCMNNCSSFILQNLFPLNVLATAICEIITCTFLIWRLQAKGNRLGKFVQHNAILSQHPMVEIIIRSCTRLLLGCSSLCSHIKCSLLYCNTS